MPLRRSSKTGECRARVKMNASRPCRHSPVLSVLSQRCFLWNQPRTGSLSGADSLLGRLLPRFTMVRSAAPGAAVNPDSKTEYALILWELHSQPTVFQCLSTWLRISQPSSVTSTKSSPGPRIDQGGTLLAQWRRSFQAWLPAL